MSNRADYWLDLTAQPDDIQSMNGEVSKRFERLEDQLRTVQASSHPGIRHWWKNNAIGIFSVGIALIALLHPMYVKQSDYEFDSRVNRLLNDGIGKKVEQHGEAIARIEASVKSIDGYLQLLLKKGLGTSASLPPERLRENLDVLHAQLRTATTQGVIVDSPVVDELRRKMLDISTEADHYWPTVASVIQYISYVRSGVANRRLRVCGPPQNDPGLLLAYESDCLLILDGKSFANVAYKDAIVVYRGGPVSLKEVQFINCYFVLEEQQSPPASGRELMMAMLRGDLARVSVKSVGAAA